MFVNPELLMKLVKTADHPEDRLNERTRLQPHILSTLRKQIQGKQLPRGTHHVVLPDGSYAVIKEINGKYPRHVLATVLGRNMSPPGEDITHLVAGRDPDERTRSEVGFGKHKRHEAHSHYKKLPNGFESSQSYSEVKVASQGMQYSDRALSVLTYPKSSIQKHMERMRGEREIISISLEQIPLIYPPHNDDQIVLKELEDILSVMADGPLSNVMVEKCDEDILGVFMDVCNSLDLDPNAYDVEIILEDLTKIGLILKYVFNRPRPAMVAPYVGKKIKPLDTNTADSPSYPSAHALGGYGLAKFYSDMYPDFMDEFYSAADAIALSRIQAGLHFPSDLSYAKLIADFIFGQEKQPNMKQVNSLPKSNVIDIVENVKPKQSVNVKELPLQEITVPKPIKDDLDEKFPEKKASLSINKFSNLKHLLRK